MNQTTTKSKLLIGALALCIAAACFVLVGCGSSNDESSADESSDATINVTSREDGSGTRGAFIELFGIEEEDDRGEKVDKTTDAAAITNSTAVIVNNDNAVDELTSDQAKQIFTGELISWSEIG